MIGARWANATGGGNRMDHPAHMQGGEEVTVTKASRALKVGERGIYHAKVVLSDGTPEILIAAPPPPRTSATRPRPCGSMPSKQKT